MPEGEISEEDLKNMSAEEIAELQKQNCIFCKIASKEIPAKVVHEDSDCMCILDINPASEGHILVYPKKHFMILPHMPEDAIQKLFKNVKLMSHTLLKSLQCKGTTIFIANGAAAGQRAPHVLIHVFPRKEGDGLVQLPKYEMNDEQLTKLKSALKPYLKQLFGKDSIKEAEFTEKEEENTNVLLSEAEDVEEKAERVVKENIQQNNNQEIKKESNEDQSSKKTSPKKESKPKREEKSDDKNSINSEKKQNKKVDLDDIARLFG